MRALLLPVLLFALQAPAAAEDVPVEPAGEIVIGATLPLTGHFDNYGQSAYYGAVTAVKVINAEGGINGKKLVLEWRDNRSDPERAAADVESLARDFGVQAIVGPLFSDAALRVKPLAERLETVVVTPMATMESLTTEPPWLFRACFSNSRQAAAMVRFMREKFGAERCGLVYDPRYVFSREFAEVFERSFAASGGKVVGTFSIIDDRGGKDYEAPLRRLAELAPDFIFAPFYSTEAFEIVRAAKELRFDVRFCGPMTWDNEQVYDACGTRLAGTAIVSTLFEKEFSYRPFQVFWAAMEQAGMDTPDAQAASSYDSVMLLANAMRNGGTSREIRDALLEVRQLPLATGRISINAAGEASKPVLIRLVERQKGWMAPVYAERYEADELPPSPSGTAD